MLPSFVITDSSCIAVLLAGCKLACFAAPQGTPTIPMSAVIVNHPAAPDPSPDLSPPIGSVHPATTWTMATDPSSGRPYWHNAAGETTWDDPALANHNPPRDPPREARLAQMDMAAVRAELERDNNDEAYSKMLHERLAALEMTPAPPPLTYPVGSAQPAMWTMATDPSSGRAYWHNAAGQTTWDDPALAKF